jgi:CheY-like chemotaxis protein
MKNMREAKHTILWADDDADDLQLMHEALDKSDHNFNIAEANNGLEALALLKKMNEANDLPCLIILDMNMPIMCGRKTLAAIKKEKAYRDIPVIIFTTSASELDRLFCKQFDVDMVTKPTSFESFKTVVNRLVSTCNQQAHQ